MRTEVSTPAPRPAARARARWAMTALLVLLAAAPVGAQGKQKPAQVDAYDALFARYLEEARRSSAPPPGSDWTWMNALGADRRARRVNDLITIRVVESITASGTADSSLTKSSSANHSLLALFGLE